MMNLNQWPGHYLLKDGKIYLAKVWDLPLVPLIPHTFPPGKLAQNIMIFHWVPPNAHILIKQ